MKKPKLFKPILIGHGKQVTPLQVYTDLEIDAANRKRYAGLYERILELENLHSNDFEFGGMVRDLVRGSGRRTL